MFTPAEKAEEARFELLRRRATFEETVVLGILTLEEAKRSVAVMEAIVLDYEEQTR